MATSTARISAKRVVKKTIEFTDYELVPENTTAQILGPVGSRGDYLKRVILIPEDLTGAVVFIQDGGGPGIVIYNGSSVPDLTPIVIDVNMRSRVGEWSLTTFGNDTHVIAVGKFT